MAIAPVGTPFNASAAASSTAPTIPTGIADGDLMFVMIGFIGGTGVVITPPAGWTLKDRVDSGTTLGAALYYRTASGETGGSAPYTWTFNSSINFFVSMELARGDSMPISIDVEHGQTNASSTNVDNSGVTTTVANTYLLFWAGCITASVTYTPPTGYTERLDAGSAEIAYKTPQAAIGATGTVTAVVSSAGVNFSFLVAIKETVPVLEQEGYRVRNDDGSETTATWAAAQDTSATVPLSTTFRLRVIINATGNPPSHGYKLQYRKSGTTPWRDVP